MRVAIVHYWLLTMRGGEKVVESLCELFPDADIFTLFYDPERVSSTIRSHKVTASFLGPFRKYYRSLLPLMPMAVESFDLRGYDLVISSESGPAKGVIAPSVARHVCYCHTPMRYLWECYADYRLDWTQSAIKRALMVPLANYLRLWDYASAARVHEFIANSANTQRRIMHVYGRDSEVVHPPVAVHDCFWQPSDDYYLVVSELVKYKRIDMAVKVCSATGRKLKVVGDGPEYANLRASAGASVEFCGRVPDGELRALYARCRAFLMPGEEDFGITPVEALASGKPVIALGRGGALETVPVTNPLGGIFYSDPEEDQLTAAIDQFEALDHMVRPSDLQAWAQQFSDAEFKRRMMAVFDCGVVDNAKRLTTATSRAASTWAAQ
jgi:glycosyltransferase involved in cell wall biosynthesis